MSRGQANLPALAVALLVLTTVAALAVTMADASVRSAERNAADRAAAAAAADRLVAADSPTTERGNVLTADSLDADSIEASLPADAESRVTLDGESVYERGDPVDGETVRRIVLVADRQTATVEPPFEFRSVTLPRRSPRATLDIEASADIETVRANDRVVLHEPGGLDGTYDVPLSRYETTTLRVDGFPEAGEVTVTYYPRQTRKALLEVTADV